MDKGHLFPSSWRERPQIRKPFFAVLRHAERADSVWQEDGFAVAYQWWPYDPPLSADGLLHARVIGEEIRSTCCMQSCKHAEEHVVVSSPYMRCWQTAVEVCLAMGPCATLLIDHSIGEVYGPDVFGEVEPLMLFRPSHEVRAYCKACGVRLRKCRMGKMPTWPEFRPQANARLLESFLKYLQRSALAKRNFTLVMHADGVASTLSAMPVMNDRQVEYVGFGGYFVATLSSSLPWSNQSTSAADRMTVPASTAPETDDEPRGIEVVSDECCAEKDISAFSATDGWQVNVSSAVLLGTRGEGTGRRASSWLRKTSFSLDSIQKLLHGSPAALHVLPWTIDQSIEEADGSSLARQDSDVSRISSETLKFGGSDYAPSEMNSPISATSSWTSTSLQSPDNPCSTSETASRPMSSMILALHAEMSLTCSEPSPRTTSLELCPGASYRNDHCSRGVQNSIQLTSGSSLMQRRKFKLASKFATS